MQRVQTTRAHIAVLLAAVSFGTAPVSGAGSLQAVSVRTDETGTPRALFGIRTGPSAGGSPGAAALEFIHLYADELRIPPGTDLRAISAVTAPGGSHIRLQQFHEGLRVLGAEAVVSLDEHRAVTAYTSTVHNDLARPTPAPVITPGQALTLARQAIGTTGPSIGKPDSVEQVISGRTAQEWTRAFRVLISSESPSGDWEVMLEAATGRVLSVRDLYVYSQTVQGQGLAFLPDPLSAAHRMYGSPGLTDNNDADSDSLTLLLTPVTLDSITVDNGVYSLQGPYVTITDIESPSDPPLVTSGEADGFAFTRNAQHFEAVNAYYHAVTACRHVESLGFFIPGLRSLRIDPHGVAGEDNSRYSPTGNWIAFGEGGVDDAEDADVIWHEYGHAVIFGIVPSWGGGESGALGEGISDYFAASYSRSFSQWVAGDYHYQWLFNWDGHNPFWSGRVLNDPRCYPFGPLPIHSAGQIVSAALMGIREALGRTTTDQLVLKALCYLGPAATAPDFARALLQADQNLHGGTHASTLVYWLGTVKKFINPDQYTLSAGEDPGTPARSGLGASYPNPFNPETSVPFTISSAGEVRLDIFDAAGRFVVTLFDGRAEPGTHLVRWDGRSAGGLPVSSGVYYCRMLLRGSALTLRQARPMVLVR